MNHEKTYNGLSFCELKQFLEEKHDQYNNPLFIKTDPVSIPHRFTLRNDREIAGFLAAAIAWGRRDLILRSSNILLEMMDNRPFDFIMSADKTDFQRVSSFVHRTFNGSDCGYFIRGLRHIYSRYSSMEDVLLEGMGNNGSVPDGLSYLRNVFFSLSHPSRIEKHFADVKRGAAGKRLNMLIRIIKVA